MLFRTLFTALTLAATAVAAPPSSHGRPPMAIVPITKPASLLGSHYQVREPKTDSDAAPANVGRLVPRAMPFPRYLAQRDQYEDDYVSNVGPPPPPPQVPPPPAYPEFPPPPPSSPSGSASGSTATHTSTHSHKKGEEKHKEKEKDQEQEKKRVRAKGKASEDVKGKSS